MGVCAMSSDSSRFFDDSSVLPRIDLSDASPDPYPPSGLDGLPPHDANLWGDLFSEDGKRLVRLADLVLLMRQRTGRQAVQVLAAHVLNKIEDGKVSQFYELRPGADAWLIHHDEWLMPDDHPGNYYGGGNWRLGTIECLRWFWIEKATGFSALDQGPHAALAICEADALRIFCRVQAGAGVAMSGATPPEWIAAEYQSLVDEYEADCNVGGRGAAARLLKRWATIFPARKAVSVTRVKALLTAAEGMGITPTMAVSWVAPLRAVSAVATKQGKKTSKNVRRSA